MPATAQDGAPPTVMTDEAEAVRLVETTPVLAQLVATVDSEIATRAAGVVSEVAFRVGDRVREDDLLVQIDDDLASIRRRTARAALEAAEAGVEVAEASARRAEQAFERQSGLQGSTAFSKGQYEDLEASLAEARAAVGRARAEVGQARAELARAEYDVRQSTIRAPFSGVVVERHAQPGSYIALGDAVARVLDVSALEIEADMPVRLVPGLSEGMTLTARFDQGPELEATVRGILPLETVSTRTRPVRLSADLADAEDLPLAAGKSITLEVPVTAPREALVVPKDALVQSAGAWTVMVVEDGTVARRQVELGQSDGERIEVLSGLSDGEVVVVRGNERLRPGQKVTPRPAERAAETAAGGAEKS
jgi:RND family efflux transporter MFP subunit